MTFKEALEIIADIEYKPECTGGRPLWINMMRSYGDSFSLRIALMRIPVGNPTGDKVPITATISITDSKLKQFNEADFLDYVLQQILHMERHEAEEWFQYKGIRIFDPHKNDPVT